MTVELDKGGTGNATEAGRGCRSSVLRLFSLAEGLMSECRPVCPGAVADDRRV